MMLRSFVPIAVTGLVALSVSTSAQAACSQLDGKGFAGFVDDAMAAIDDDDLVRHGAVFRAMQEQLPCLDEQVPIQPWSEFLVGFAVVEYAMGREWEQALDVALRVNPTVPREFGPVEIRSYASDVELEPVDARTLPSGAVFYVDGKQVEREPNLGKLHIVQRHQDGVWTSFLLQGEPWPEEWKNAPVVAETEDDGAAVRATIYALAGLSTGSQSLGGQPSALIPEPSTAGALFGLGSFGDYAPGGPVGLFWDVTGPFNLTGGIGSGMAVEAYVGPAIFAGPLAIDVGVGMTTVGVEDVDSARLVIVPQPHLGARFVNEIVDGLDMDLSAGGGWIFSGWHGKLHAGVRGGGKLGWNAGLTASGNGGVFDEASQGSQLTANTSAWRVGVRGGISLGQ